MCGFAGLFHADAPRGEALIQQASRMAELVQHRGPDDAAEWADPTGRVALAFRRLAILDLSTAGRQPMTSMSGRYVMVFNGEVYNFADIRARLNIPDTAFRGTSDSEVILAAFDKLGVTGALERMIGMFAVALWDRRDEELWLIRDRMGIKPLYVASTSRGVAFASQLGALTRAPGFNHALDSAALASYLRYLFIPGRATPFQHVQKVPPGHYLRIRDPRQPLPEPEPFWTTDASRTGPDRQFAVDRDEDGVVTSLEALLTEAVNMRMVADVPVGALLSGGVDSSLVVALMQRSANRPVRTFTVGFGQSEHDESNHARAVAEHLGTDHVELQVSGDDALALVPNLAGIFDEPLANPSQIPTQLVSRLARQSVVVALSGDGGDELFGGYNRYTAGPRAVRRVSMIPRIPRRWLGAAFRAVPVRSWDRVLGVRMPNGRPLRLAGQKAHKIARMLSADSPADMYHTLLSAWDDPERFLASAPAAADPIRRMLDSTADPVDLDAMMYLDQLFYLPDDLLQKVDRASMSVGLEVRVPILDHRVVERSWTLPSHYKVRGGDSKWILRAILDRHVPRRLVERPKTGFSVPVDSWLAGELRPWAEDLLLSDSPGKGALLNHGEITKAWRQFLGGRTEYALGLWSVVMLEAWLRHWGVGHAVECA
jgi:asparagine synthase (glutamine-hydrolysing)